jgi:cytochrome c
MASSLEVNKTLAAILTAGIIASGAGVISRILYSPHMPEEKAYPIEVASTGGEGAGGGGEAAPAVSLAALLAGGDPEHGQKVAKACGACHNFGEGEPNKIGPHLYGVIGRDIASVSDFSYSDALSQKEGAWDYEKLSHFLANPKGWAPGTKMTFAGLKKQQDLADVILYLRSISPDAPPLPEPEAETETAAAGAGEPAAGAQAAAGEQAATGEQAAAGAAGTGEQAASGQAGGEQAAASAPTAEGAKAPAQEPASQQVAATQPGSDQTGAQPAAAGQGEGGLGALLAAADPAAGEKDAKKCAVCHNFDQGGAAKLGPPLWGVLGRDIASVDGFKYSDALASKDGAWDYDKLDAFLTNPREWAPGTKMAFAGVKKPAERADIISFLRSLSDNPEPLPAGG